MKASSCDELNACASSAASISVNDVRCEHAHTEQLGGASRCTRRRPAPQARSHRSTTRAAARRTSHT